MPGTERSKRNRQWSWSPEFFGSRAPTLMRTRSIRLRTRAFFRGSPRLATSARCLRNPPGDRAARRSPAAAVAARPAERPEMELAGGVIAVSSLSSATIAAKRQSVRCPVLLFGARDLGEVDQCLAHGRVVLAFQHRATVRGEFGCAGGWCRDWMHLPARAGGATADIFDFVATSPQKRTHDAGRQFRRGVAKGRDGSQAAGPGATQDAQEHGFCLVV